MPKPGEYKTVQTRVLQYAQDIGWNIVSRAEAEQRRNFDSSVNQPSERSRHASLFFNDLLYQKAREFNPLYNDSPGALVGQLRRLSASIHGNREFLTFLRNGGKFFHAVENRELDLMLVDYTDPSQNVYEVTEEFYWHNGRFGNREDVVFLINGVPVLVVECKNADKDEGIALGIDQIRRYHIETPELFIPQMAFTATDALGFDYGATWNVVHRNIFHWKHEQIGQLEAKVKSFFDIPRVLRLLKDYILFAEIDEKLEKYILAQHQTATIQLAVQRAHDPCQAARAGMAYARQRQDLHHAQDRRTAVQSA